jgi:hypothetical protein
MTLSQISTASWGPRRPDEIRRQLDELRDILQDARAYGAADFAAEITLASLQSHEAELVEELAAAEMIISGADLELVLDGDPVEGHAVHAAFLAAVLGRVQKLTNSLAQAGYSASADVGQVFRNVIAENRLLVAGWRPSSFAVQLRLAPRAPGEAAADDGATETVNTGPTPQEVLESVAALLDQEVPTPRMLPLLVDAAVKRDFADLLNVIAKQGANLRVRTRRRPYGVKVTSRQARDRVEFIDTLQTREVTRSIRGVLVGGSIESKKFELRSGDTIYRGKVTTAAQTLMRQYTWGADVVADVRVSTKAHEEGLGTPTVTYTLVGLSRPQAGA